MGYYFLFSLGNISSLKLLLNLHVCMYVIMEYEN